MFLLSKTFHIVIDKLNCHIKILNIIPLILFKVIAGLTDKILNSLVFTLFNCLRIKQVVDFK